MTSSVPARRVISRSASWNPGSGCTIPMFVSAGSASTQATSPCASAASSAGRSLNSTTRVVSEGFTGGPRLPLRGPTTPSRERRERLVDRAVVAPVEDQDLRPLRHVPRQADGEAVGVGRRERRLPEGQAEPARELFADPDRVLGRQHERDAAPRALGDRRDRGRGRVAGHRAGVAEAEVQVAPAVDVGEAGAGRFLDEDRESCRASAPSSSSGRRRAGSSGPARTGPASEGASP